MQIEVTAQNIDDYGLDKLSGNTKEELLKIAADAAMGGHILYFKVPDHTQVQNVFDRFSGRAVDPKDLEHGQNPIEQWDGKEIPEEERQAAVHACGLPQLANGGDEFACPECRKRYYAERSSPGFGLVDWIDVGELLE